MHLAQERQFFALGERFSRNKFSSGHCSGHLWELLYYHGRTSLNEIMFLSGESLVNSTSKASRLSFFVWLLLGLTFF